MYTYYCPNCFKEFDVENILYKCSNRNNHEKHRYIQNTLFFKAPKNIFSKELVGICPICKENSTEIHCPSCNYHIEAINNVHTVALAGAKSSGKTVYLGSLLQELKSQAESFALKADLSLESDTKAKQMHIVTGKTLYAATDKGTQEPFIIKLEKNRGHKKTNLVIFDVAGEDLVKGFSSDNLRQFKKADLIIYLIDVLQLKEVRSYEKVIESIKYHTVHQSNKEALDTIIKEIREAKKIPRKKKIDTPIAVCLSLIDVVKDLYTNESFVANQNYNIEGYSIDKVNELSKDVRELLVSKWNEKELILTIENNFKDIMYFSVSSLGFQPDNANKVDIYDPLNVLDPVLWYLDKIKAI